MFNVYLSHRMEDLVDALAPVVAKPAGEPLESEWIAVPSLGMRSWLAMELARKLGIWSNGRFALPRELVRQLVDLVLEDRPTEPDPYQPDRLRWAVMAELSGLLDQPAFAPLRQYLQRGDSARKRFGLARRIADAFDQYVVYRPEMLLRWERKSEGDWQSELWRALVERLGAK